MFGLFSGSLYDGKAIELARMSSEWNESRGLEDRRQIILGNESNQNPTKSRICLGLSNYESRCGWGMS